MRKRQMIDRRSFISYSTLAATGLLLGKVVNDPYGEERRAPASFRQKT
jgi:hypothetical protein